MIQETIGKLLPNNKVELEFSGQGFIYQNPSNFLNKKGICYIPENGVDYDNNIENSYTYNDLLKLVKEYINKPNNEIDKKEFLPENIVITLFETLDWQTPETLIEEWENYDINRKYN